MKYRDEILEALRLLEILVPIPVRGLYQVVLEGITVAAPQFDVKVKDEDEDEDNGSTESEE